MKPYEQCILSIMLSVLTALSCKAETFTISLKPKWRCLEEDCKKAAEFGGKWILAGSITFKKRSKDHVFIEMLNLHWNGENLDNLIGSLYRKNLDKELFLPIEENLVCDGIWNKNKQTLVLNFDEKESLAPTTTYYLVLTVPDDIEPILKKGSFYLEEQNLPKPFKQCAQQEKLSLAFNELPGQNAQAPKIH